MTHDFAEGISLLTADGHTLAADMRAPAGAPAGAVICHPHPVYGGDRHASVVDALYRGLSAAGIAVLRFDFRRVARAATGEGVAERADVVAALHRLATEVDAAAPRFSVQLWLLGNHFCTRFVAACRNGRFGAAVRRGAR